MKVVDDIFGLDVQKALQVGKVRLKRPIRQQVLEVTRVRRHVGTAAAGQCEGVLEFRADRQ